MPLSAVEVYGGSDGAVTRAYYAALEQRGPIGIVAVNLFRAARLGSWASGYTSGA